MVNKPKSLKLIELPEAGSQMYYGKGTYGTGLLSKDITKFSKMESKFIRITGKEVSTKGGSFITYVNVGAPSKPFGEVVKPPKITRTMKPWDLNPKGSNEIIPSAEWIKKTNRQNISILWERWNC